MEWSLNHQGADWHWFSALWQSCRMKKIPQLSPLVKIGLSGMSLVPGRRLAGLVPSACEEGDSILRRFSCSGAVQGLQLLAKQTLPPKFLPVFTEVNAGVTMDWTFLVLFLDRQVGGLILFCAPGIFSEILENLYSEVKTTWNHINSSFLLVLSKFLSGDNTWT